MKEANQVTWCQPLLLLPKVPLLDTWLVIYGSKFELCSFIRRLFKFNFLISSQLKPVVASEITFVCVKDFKRTFKI